MALSELKFIFCFLPAFLILYLPAKGDLKKYIMLSGSMLFYYIGAGAGALLLLSAMILSSFYAAKLIAGPGSGKAIFRISCTAMLLPLLFYKYLRFFFTFFSSSDAVPFRMENIIIPLGISFFTFEIISYLADVKRGTIEPEHNLLSYACFITSFPKLMSGPIVRFKDFQYNKPTRPYIEDGFALFVIGLGMKVLIADSLSQVWEFMKRTGFEYISTPLAWIGAASYSLELYFDFNGYSLMAKGIGSMCGYDIPLNFDLPYISRSVSEFWRRWHITLGTWFRDYVYIPLGGSRNGEIRMVLSLFTVWILTGLWHGAGWNFILWGSVHYIFIVSEKLFFKSFPDRHPVLSRFLLCFIIIQTWIIFAIESPASLGAYFSRLYPFFNNGGAFYSGTHDFLSIPVSCYTAALTGIILCLPFTRKFYEKHKRSVLMTVLLFIVFWSSVYLVSVRGSGSFIYFNF